MQSESRNVVAADGARIHFEVEGHGPPLVLLHGFMGSTFSWRRCGYVDALQASYRLVLVDARGHGQSEKSYDVQAHSIEKRAGDVIAVLDDLGLDQAHVWGYSMGGRLALEVGRSFPERARTLLVGGMSGEAPNKRQRPGLERRAIRLEARAAEALPSIGQVNDEKHEGRGGIRRSRFSNDPRALAASMRGVLDWRGVEEDLPRLALPVLLYCGEFDALLEQAWGNSRMLPKGRFVLLEGLNHRQAFQRSDLVLQHVLAFLRRQES